MMNVGTVAELVKEYRGAVVDIRRQIHSKPELAFEEEETGRLVAAVLDDLGIPAHRGIAQTGVVGVLSGGNPGPTIAIRADMDALPITERTGLPFQSGTSGLMHACGHDGHVAIALGTAMVLSRLRQHLKGNVKFIFQPAEERLAGAAPMIEQGVLDSPKVDSIFAIHLWPDVPFGHLGVNYGVAMAGCDRFSIYFAGKGGHGANPHLGIDTVTASSLGVLSLQTVVSREIDPVVPAVLSIGTIRGGTAFNTIADKVELHGTVRAVNQSVSDFICKAVKQKLDGVALATGTQCDLSYVHCCPALVNDQSAAGRAHETAGRMLGDDGVHVLHAPSMIAEDFACYLDHVPGAMLFLGIGPKAGEADGCATCYPLHHPEFGFDEEILSVGTEFLTRLTIDSCKALMAP